MLGRCIFSYALTFMHFSVFDPPRRTQLRTTALNNTNQPTPEQAIYLKRWQKPSWKREKEASEQ